MTPCRGLGPDHAVCLQVSRLVVLDPQKRLSVREALQHPWVLGKAARFSHMDTTQRKLQEFNARRKLKVSLASSLGHATSVCLRQAALGYLRNFILPCTIS